MEINLKDIPDEGKHFSFTEQDQEFAQTLEDLISKHKFEVDLFIRPLGNTFDVKGFVKTDLPRECSKCGTEFNLPLDEKFHEHLIVNTERAGQGVYSDSLSPSIAKGWNFYANEFAHEVIGLADPLQPICKSDCKGLCFTCGEDLNLKTCACAKSQDERKKPFSVLKNLKLN